MLERPGHIPHVRGPRGSVPCLRAADSPRVPAPALLRQAGLHAPAWVRRQGTGRFCGLAEFGSGSGFEADRVCNILLLNNMERCWGVCAQAGFGR